MKSWIKCVIFDLDGVIAETSQLHLQALKEALRQSAKFSMDEEWYRKYDGITSQQKLNILTAEHGLPIECHAEVMRHKKDLTLMLLDRLTPDMDKTRLFQYLKTFHDVFICIASNSRRDFVERVLQRMNLLTNVDLIKAGDNVRFTKPNPQIYLTCMADLGVAPSETVIFEDAPAGKKAALDSGAHLVPVKHTNDVTLPWVIREIRNAERNCRYNQFDSVILHGLKNVNVVVPMAGHGSRFAQAGFKLPKPFIEIRGKSMVNVTIDSIGIPGRYIYCAQATHVNEYDMQMKELVNYNDQVVPIFGVTEGAACTVLLATEHIDNDDPLFIINSDQYIDWDWSRFMIEMAAEKADGGIVCFEASDRKWSFAKTEPGTNRVIEVAEKNPISTHATAGIYYWRRGSDFVKYANQMIEKNIRVNKEFYVCPVYNEAIEAGLKIVTFPCERMLGMGTPDDLMETMKKI